MEQLALIVTWIHGHVHWAGHPAFNKVVDLIPLVPDRHF